MPVTIDIYKFMLIFKFQQDLQNKYNSGDEFQMYKALLYRMQVVEGTNYLVKVILQYIEIQYLQNLEFLF